MPDEVVQYEVKGPIATIWINRPEVNNRPRVLELLGEYARKAEELIPTGKLLSGGEAKEGVAAFLEKRTPNWVGR